MRVVNAARASCTARRCRQAALRRDRHPAAPQGVSDYDEAIGKALAEVGLPAELAAYATSDEYDAQLRASHEEGISQVGQEVGTPVISINGVGMFGPVMTPAPKGEAAGKLWDGFLLVTATPGFYELKRTRDVGPIFD